MPTSRFPSAYLDALDRRVLIYDGAMGTNIQRAGLTAADFGGQSLEGCNDNLVLTRPDVIQSIHESFLAVGCDVVETCTFQSTPRRLTEWGLGDKVDAINVGAARLARAACDKYATPEQPRFVAGSMGPTGMLPSSADATLSAITFAELAENYYQPGEGAGRRRCRCSTHRDLAGHSRGKGSDRGHRAAVRRARTPRRAAGAGDARHERAHAPGHRHRERDDHARVTRRGCDRAQLLDRPGAHARAGPLPRRARATARSPCIPNAGLPLNTGVGEAVYPLEPAPMAAALAEFVRDFGVRIVGGCCGTTPRASQCDRRGGDRRSVAANGQTDRKETHVPRVSSAMRAITLHQDPPPLLIGERVNAQGSRKVKRLLLAEDYEGIVQVAREQVEAGAHVLDVCVAVTERADEAVQMAEVVKLLSMTVESPIMIDSTELDVDQGSARAHSRSRDRQLDQHGERAHAHRQRASGGEGERRRGGRAHDRRGRDGEDRRAEARDRAPHPRHRDDESTGSRRRTSSSTRSPSRSPPARRSGSTRRTRRSRGSS